MAEYDYVIVGAGSAGCVLANRLSADPSVSVLLVEAGASDRAMNVRIPAAFSKLFKTERDWDYSSEPEPHLDGRSLYIPRGKMLGGSSSMNAMIYIRGNRADYDGWAEQGAKGWSYDEVLPYFRRAENNERGADAFHGSGGPLNVKDLGFPNPVSERFVDGGVEAGIPRNDDFNGADQEGMGLFQVTQKKGRRWSAANGYLRPVLKRQEPDAADRGAGSEGGRHARPGDRGGVRPRRRDDPGPRPPRGHALRRRHQLAAAADALGHRPRRPPARLRHRRPAGQPERRASTCRTTRSCLMSWETSAKGTLAEAEKPLQPRPLPAHQHRAAQLQHRRGRRLLPQLGRARRRRTCSSTSPPRSSRSTGSRPTPARPCRSGRHWSRRRAAGR